MPAQHVTDSLIRDVVSEVARLAMAPEMRSYSQPEFSRARLTIRMASAGLIAGRPDTSAAWSRRTSEQPVFGARTVSGRATEATFSRPFRPTRLPISPRLERSSLVSRSRFGRCALRIRFSAARHSTGSSNS